MDVLVSGYTQLSGFCRWVVWSVLEVVLASAGRDRVLRSRIGPPRDVLACLVVGRGLRGHVGIWFRVARQCAWRRPTLPRYLIVLGLLAGSRGPDVRVISRLSWFYEFLLVVRGLAGVI